jgi:hypothetical protein
MNDDIKLSFTQQEAQALIDLINRAVRAGGLQIAENAKKIVEAVHAASQEPRLMQPSKSTRRE